MVPITKKQMVRVGAVVLAGTLGMALRFAPREDHSLHLPKAHTGMKWEYTREGFGGFVQVPIHAKPEEVTPWNRAVKAYAAGRYEEASTLADQTLAQTEGATQPRPQHRHLQAMSLIAYCAAWKKDFSLAKETFAGLKQAAAQLPDHGQEQCQ